MGSPAYQAQRNLTIVEQALAGVPLTQIGKDIGLSTARVSQILSSDKAIKQQIEDCQKAQVILLPIAIRKHAELLESDDPAIVKDMIKITYANTGITPNHSPSILIQNLFINQDNMLGDPEFRSMAMRFLGMEDDNQVIDVTPSEVK